MIHEMVFDAEDLRTLGMVFDESWDFLLIQHPEFGPEMRLRLAALLLHLEETDSSAPIRSRQLPFG